MAPEKMKMQQKQQLRQELLLTPQLLQSMEVLQMNAQELLDHVNAALEENPVLERGEDTAKQREYAALRSCAVWLDADGMRLAEPAADWGDPAQDTEELSGFLCEQLDRRVKDKAMLALCRYMARLVDEDGYLPQEDLDSVSQLRIPQAMVEEALEILQSLEPAGVAARNLEECLTLQLQRNGEKDPVALAIVQKHLQTLGRGHYGAIARALQCSEKQVRAAAEKIAQLHPRPGSGFGGAEKTLYVRPDIFVLEHEGAWQAVRNEYYMPNLSINAYYETLLRQARDEETKEYLREKLRQARWLIQNLERRGNTLQRCADLLVVRQKAFFTGRTTELEPMTLRQLAQELEMHPSTATRALRGKYLQCRQGTYPLRYFFSGVTGGVSRQAVQQKLLALLREEDGAHPYSDEKLSALLAQQGVEIARRTVAKYREEMHIPSATRRRRREK
ncbi:MAG: RNA polymerase factor sigma-54 [Ruminococcaceae bacterium]|nr:RNA polymerase factor sigma-54 [Oscillospiraceae bacterium]